MIAILDQISDSQIHQEMLNVTIPSHLPGEIPMHVQIFTTSKKCQMLDCEVVVMKVTNKKKGIFSFYSHDMNKKFQ